MKKILILLAVFIAYSGLQAAEISLWPKNTKDLKKWNAPAQMWEKDDSGNYILVVKNNQPGGGRLIEHKLDLEKYRGYALAVSVEIKADNVSKPEPPWLGIKFMMPHTTAGVTTWLSATDGRHGSHDWKPYELSMNISPFLDSAVIALGLQASTGEVRFRNLKAKLIPPDVLRPMPYKLPDDFKCEYSPAVKNRPVRRGAMFQIPALITEKDIRDFAAWGGNLIRWQFQTYKAHDMKYYHQVLDESLAKLKKLEPLLKELDVKVIFDMHETPGGRLGSPAVLGTAGGTAVLDGSSCMRIFVDDFCLNEYINAWKKIATALKDSGIIWGYELLNEPTAAGQKTKYHYLLAQYEAAKEIRKIDPETPIIVESDEWANPSTFSYLSPLPLKNIIYAFHFYEPGPYTHQGTSSATMEEVKKGNLRKYPSETFDKNSLRKTVMPIQDFANRYHAQVVCSEFSVIRWAPGAEQWLEDIISIFEENNWNWTYHAFREWHGWSVEHDSDWRNENPVNYNTKRKEILLEHFKKQR